MSASIAELEQQCRAHAARIIKALPDAKLTTLNGTPMVIYGGARATASLSMGRLYVDYFKGAHQDRTVLRKVCESTAWADVQDA